MKKTFGFCAIAVGNKDEHDSAPLGKDRFLGDPTRYGSHNKKLNSHGLDSARNYDNGLSDQPASVQRYELLLDSALLISMLQFGQIFPKLYSNANY